MAAFGASSAIRALRQDVTAGDAADTLVGTIQSELDGLDILVNNAGVPGDLGPIEETSDASWARVFSVNVDAVFRISRACIPLLRESAYGRIITTSSVNVDFGLRRYGPYVASKHAVSGLMKGLPIELGRNGITVNCINPANVVTGMTRSGFPAPNTAEGRAYLDAATVLNRSCQQEEVVSAAVFLASDGGAYITGQAIVVDGGMTCRLPSLSERAIREIQRVT
ncbi:short chain dehydrogenase (plasmid) [Sphingobium sp. TKS]|nr:short chain dehydrogenase [Sphingobium sp. TKS]